MSVEVKDTGEVYKKLKKLSSDVIDERMFKVMKYGGRLVKKAAEARAAVGSREPYRGVGTGRLKKSMRVKTSSKKLTVKVEAWYPKNARVWEKSGRKEYYAFAVEYGTRKKAARPFLHPALEAEQSTIENLLILEFGKLADEIS